jgi:osmotically-inducible protein OsmY
MNQRHNHITPLLAALLATAALGACSPKADNNATVGQKIDEGVAKVEQKTEAAKAEISAESKSATEAMKETGQDIKQAAEKATDKVSNAVSDAAITTAINAELAKDQKLSALKINVDTAQGRVALRGSAPDPESKDRATRIAAGVKGVMSVDNLLNVEAKS